MSKKSQVQMEALRALDDDPEGQAARAIELLAPSTGRAALLAALQVLIQRPQPEARAKLRRIYEHYGARDGMADPGTYVRSRIVQALRPVALAEDEELFVAAATTYNFPPPDFREEGALLRASALLALNELNADLTLYHATRLLADEYTDPMSGEPGVSAAEMLAVYDCMFPLYFYVSQTVEHMVPEVAATCLRHLVELPTPLVAILIDRLSEANKPLIQMGLFDLMIGHRAGPQDVARIRTWLDEGGELDLYQYQVAALVAAGQESLIDLVIAHAEHERNLDKATVLIRMLAPLAHDKRIQDTLEVLDRRLDGRSVL